MKDKEHCPPWRKEEGEHWILKMIVDSGAVTSVVPTNLIPGAIYRETEKSKAGLHYRVANGARIPNRGELDIIGKTATGIDIKLKGQVTDVDKPLLSTKEIVMAGNRIVHELNNDYIENIKTGKRIPIDNQGGEYTVQIRVAKAGSKTYAEVVSDTKKGFIGQVGKLI